MGEEELLEFYKKQLNEFQTSDDKYREKVDKYLGELIDDRHELVAENLRRGEKISDLQTALVDLQLSCFDERERFLKVTAENGKLKANEKRLHENIRYLLDATKEKDLRDRIIYILDDPKVEIGYQHGNSKSSDTFSTAYKHKQSSNEFLKEQVQQLQAKLDEHSKISQNKADVLFEDCKIILEMSREKLVQSEDQIRMLQKRVHDAEELLYKENRFSTGQSSLANNEAFKLIQVNAGRSGSKSLYELKSSPTLKENTSSIAADMRFSLISLSKIIKKSLSLLHSIQSSQVFAQAAKQPKPAGSNHKYVNETDIIMLQNYIRQCTRLSFETRNALKSLAKSISSVETSDKELNLVSELKELQSAVEELAVATAEADLITINLSRATFFDYLTAPKQSFSKFGVKEMSNCSKYVSDVNKMVTNLKNANAFALKAVKFVEKLQESLENQSLSNKNQDNRDTSVQDPEMNISDSLSKSRRSATTEHPSNQQDNSQSLHFSVKIPINRKSNQSSVEVNAVIKRINKTLAKIKQIESGEYAKDNEFCQYLGEQVKALTEKLKELYNEFNVQDMQDQFSEYASVTFSKLETIVNQSRDAVLSAEAQISAYRSNAENLSQKLKDTEDLLRESINECLSVKQKLQKEKIQRATDAAEFREELQVKLQNVLDFDDLETAVKEVISSTHSLKQAKKLHKASSLQAQQMYSTEFDDPERAVKGVISSKQSLKQAKKLHKASSLEAQQMYSTEFDDPETAVRGVISSKHSMKQTKKQHKASSLEGQQMYSTEFDDPGTAVKGVISSKHSMKQTKKQHKASSLKGQQMYRAEFDDSETESSSGASARVSKRLDVPFECMYCKQGSGHKLCDEKIKELRANNRKLSTELKILQQEMKEERKLSKMSQEQVARTNRESTNQSENLQGKLESLETRNASLSEQLNLERNRLKKMEKFHRFEIAGSKTDIKNMKIKIQELEKQLMKAVMIFEHDKNNLELLKSVHTTAQNSLHAVESMRRLKRKLYELETDLKHL